MWVAVVILWVLGGILAGVGFTLLVIYGDALYEPYESRRKKRKNLGLPPAD